MSSVLCHRLLSLLAVALVAGCGEAELPPVDAAQVTPATVAEHFKALPLALQAPDPEIASLGRLLFWDPVLSGNQDVACATCHHPALGYGDGRFASQVLED